ncbi:uncharacterized protein DDB_G0283697-like [Prorops nasuta]|uniref:uncharacterized protein DDB_G0283697-like n=1 Tax=Prorops nasuta TaxID=863751 RepID=UPI0034D01A30
MGLKISICWFFFVLTFLIFDTSAENSTSSETFDGNDTLNSTLLEEIVGDIEALASSGRYRDKRALGLILSGLAQVFGYQVSPVQLGSLANPAPAASNFQQDSPRNSVLPGQPRNSSNAPRPGQKETIRLTGIINFGNNSDLLGHLQRYEQMFHGSATTTAAPAPSAAAPPVSPTTAPQKDSRSQTRPPLLAPYLVKIPLPIAPNLLPPLVPLPKLTYSTVNTYAKPGPKSSETEYRKNQNTETYSVQSKEIFDEKDVAKEDGTGAINEEPYWKQLHEDRLSNLEQWQEQQVTRLDSKEQSEREKENNSREKELSVKSENREKELEERDKEHANRIKQQNREEDHDESSYESGEENSAELENNEESREASAEHENSQERYENQRARPNSPNSNSEESSDEDNDNRRPLESFNSYSDVKFDPPELPISDSYVKSKPDYIRDSYGEILDNQKLVDDRISSYFTMFKDPRTGVYDLKKFQSSEEDDDDRKPSAVTNDDEEDTDAGPKKLDQGFVLPLPILRYEEYDLEEPRRSDDNESREEKQKVEEEEEEEEEEEADASSKEEFQKDESSNLRTQEEYADYNSEINKPENRRGAPNSTSLRNIQIKSNETDGSHSVPGPPYQDVLSDNLSPYHQPVQYLPLDSNISSQKKPYKFNCKNCAIVPKSEEADKTELKDKPKFENLKPVIGLPEKLSTQNLHEGESKVVQIWPAPFDYVFDGSVPTTIRASLSDKQETEVTGNVDKNFGRRLFRKPENSFADRYNPHYRKNNKLDIQRTLPPPSAITYQAPIDRGVSKRNRKSQATKNNGSSVPIVVGNNLNTNRRNYARDSNWNFDNVLQQSNSQRVPSETSARPRIVKYDDVLHDGREFDENQPKNSQVFSINVSSENKPNVKSKNEDIAKHKIIADGREPKQLNWEQPMSFMHFTRL